VGIDRHWSHIFCWLGSQYCAYADRGHGFRLRRLLTAKIAKNGGEVRKEEIHVLPHSSLRLGLLSVLGGFSSRSLRLRLFVSHCGNNPAIFLSPVACRVSSAV
jgi:hypothetical protein